ncbi:hypothetical protein OIDMADRAFT_46690 [Oidiodendron maius Zn]|uniref:Uncharacterized protein n=1 Tax=Oidiodendron maius (strain Zn) TaxID=913774 RepID=A0A0C3D619_OIDMZ|nr:hypothetical protein OIDMADRAFT_46690 [Oidiodendron maius Zn]
MPMLRRGGQIQENGYAFWFISYRWLLSHLKEAIITLISQLFDKDKHPENAAKVYILDKLFKVANTEEQYKNGEIDGTVCICIAYSNAIAVDDPNPRELNAPVKNEAIPLLSIRAPGGLTLPADTTQNRPLQLGNPGACDTARTVTARHFGQPQLEYHSLSDDGSYLTRGFQPSDHYDSGNQYTANRTAWWSHEFAPM